MLRATYYYIDQCRCVTATVLEPYEAPLTSGLGPAYAFNFAGVPVIITGMACIMHVPCPIIMGPTPPLGVEVIPVQHRAVGTRVVEGQCFAEL